MKLNHYQILVRIGLISIIIIGILVWKSTITNKLSLMQIVMCDVGQGDGILFSKGSFQILVDAGPDEAILACLSKVMPPLDTSLEVVIATHADADHIGGMKHVFQQYQISLLLTPAWGRSTQVYTDFLSSVRQQISHGLKVYSPQAGDVIHFGPDIWCNIISPEKAWGDPNLFLMPTTETQLLDILALQSDDERATNDGSIGTILYYGQVSVLLTGDMEMLAEKAALKAGLIPDVDMLKVGHHGAKTSTSEEFLRVSKPEMSLVSAGRKNSYGHPAAEVITRLRSVGSQVKQTNEHGAITVMSDGTSYWLSGDEKKYGQASAR